MSQAATGLARGRLPSRPLIFCIQITIFNAKLIILNTTLHQFQYKSLPQPGPRRVTASHAAI